MVDAPQKTPQTPKKKGLKTDKKGKNGQKLTSINANKTVKNDKLKSDLKGMRHVAEYIEFIAWNALPTIIREPKLQKDFATQIGVSPDTLSDWKKRSGFREDVERQRKDWAMDQSGDILLALRKNIIQNGRGSDAKIWLQYTGEFSDKSKPNDGVNSDMMEAISMLRDIYQHKLDNLNKNKSSTQTESAT